MDFTLDENQQAVSDLANQILSDRILPEALKAAEDKEDWFDKDTYMELAKSGLLGIAVSETRGGGGLDLVAWGQILEAQGRYVAPLPLWNTALATMALDRFGTDSQQQNDLPSIISGEQIVAVGIQEWNDDDYLSPTSEATPTGGEAGEFKITGTKIVVEFVEESQKILITARDQNGEAGLYLVDLDQSQISLNHGLSTRLQPVYEVIMSGAVATALENVDMEWFTDSAIALLCATQIGVTSQALKMSAEYTSTREQFGRPIATFQAVTHRLAEQYMIVNGIKLTTHSALWNLENGKPATERVCEAKWFASHLAMQVADATQHVHGGMGVDRDYPLHRYTLWNKHIQTSLGAGTQHLRRLGSMLAG